MPITASNCIYPTNAELLRVQQDLFPRFANNRLAFQLFPFRNSEYSQIIIEEPDIFRGMQGWRGLDKPTRIVSGSWNPYGKRCLIEPGYWGEHDYITEEFMTRAAQPGTCSDVIDVTEQVVRRQERLLERAYNRIEFNIWQAAIFGRYEALNSTGQVVYEATYNVQSVAVPIPWTNYASATPLADFRALRLRGRGTSARFDSCAVAYMNQVTANNLFKNQNPNDVGKAGLSACCTFMGPEIVNQQFAAQGLPQFQVYDEGFVDDNGNFTPYIPDGKVLVVGCRPGNEKIGYYTFTRNVVGCDVTTGMWTKLVDNCGNDVPRRLTLFNGHNGGVELRYPRALVVLEVGS